MTETLEKPLQVIDTREGWLQAAIVALTPLFDEIGEKLPPVRISVGFPKSRGPNVIGQCWAPSASVDGVAQLFIHPKLGGDDVTPILATVIHELIHAIDECESGHTGRFRDMAKAIGLEGKMTATHPSAELVDRFATLLNDAAMPDYPHAVLTGEGETSAPKTQSTRMIKLECPGDGMIMRTSRKWIDEVGPPMCLCGWQFDVIEPEPRDGE